MAERIVILSDLHLGKNPGRISPERLRPIWRRGDHLISNGDLAEIHDPRYQAAARYQVLALQDLCDADGVTLTLLAGNHDPGLTSRRHLFLHHGQVLVTHGDAVDPSIAPWCVSAPLMREAYDDAMATLPVESHAHLESQLWATQQAATLKWDMMKDRIGWVSAAALLLRPWAVLQILHYWHVFPRQAAAFCKSFAPEARFLITGHTHHQGLWTVDGTTIINTGCYGFPGRPRAVVLENGRLEVRRIGRRAGLYHLDDAALASFALPGESELPRTVAAA